MFRCEYCHNCSVSREGMIKVVLETREKIYTANVRERTDGGIVIVQDKEIGRGFEIVKEAKYCRLCASEHNYRMGRN